KPLPRRGARTTPDTHYNALGRGGRLDEQPAKRSLGLLPSGPDPVGEARACCQPPKPSISEIEALVATTLSHAKLPFESALPPIKPKQHEQPNGDEAVGKDGQEVVRRVVALQHRLADVAVRGAEHEERPAQSGREPERAADPNAQEAEDAPGTVVDADLELERASRRPANSARRLVGEEDVRNEPHRQADNADIQHERIKQENAQHAKLRPRHLAEIKVRNWKQHA